MDSANERWRYNVTSSLIDLAHMQNDPYMWQLIQEEAWILVQLHLLWHITLSYLPMTKMVVISQMTFSLMKILYFDQNFTEVCPEAFNWKYVSIGSINGLLPNIMWTNARILLFRTNFSEISS